MTPLTISKHALQQPMKTTRATHKQSCYKSFKLYQKVNLEKMRFLLLSLVLLGCMLNFSNSERDFNINESQVPVLEGKDDPKHTQHQLDPYVAELLHCHSTDNEIVLSLVLADHDWSAIQENKRQQIILKLSKFFAIPKEYISLETIGKREIYEMQKKALRKGPNKCKNKHNMSRVNLILGCGDQYFSMAEPIVNQIGQQMRDGFIDNISGERFGWYIVWLRSMESRTHRHRRQALEGSGEDEYDEYDYDGDAEEENNEPVTEIPATATQQSKHAHRHHHGVSESANEFVENQLIENKFSKTDGKMSASKIDEEIVESVSQLESVISKTIENTKHIKDVIVPLINTVEDNDEPVDDIDKELKSSRIAEELQNVVARKSPPEGGISEGVTITAELPTVSSTTFLPKNNDPSRYDDNLEAIDDDLDDLDTDTTYDLPTNSHSSFGRNIESAVDAEVSTVKSPITKIYADTKISKNDAHTSNNMTSAFNTPPALLDSSTTAIETTLNSASSNSSVDISTTNTPPTSQTPHLRSPPYAPYSNSYDSYYPSSSSLLPSPSPSPSQSPSLTVLHSSNQSTPSLLLPPPSQPSSPSPQTTFDVSMLPSSSSQTPYFTVLTTTEPSQEEANHKNAQVEHIHPIVGIQSDKKIELFESSEVFTTTRSSTELHTDFSATTKVAKTSYDDQQVRTTLTDGMEQLPNVTTISSAQLAVPTSETLTPQTDLSSTTTTSATPELATPATTSSTDYAEPRSENTPPLILTRLPKINVTAGKYFSTIVPENVFFDNEDATNLRLEFHDKDGHEMKHNSWLQFNAETREIYGLPVFETPSTYFYYLTATDSGNETVTETVEIKVMQHRYVRTFNHEINITVKLNDNSMPYVDWQIKLIKGIASTLGDKSTEAIVAPEVRLLRHEPHNAVLAFFNESLSTISCPENELNDIVRRLDANRLNELVQPTLSIKSIMGELIGGCRKVDAAATKPPTISSKNLPPVPRNQVDRVNATVGHLLVYPVPPDTFYDSNDNQLVLSLKTKDHRDLSPRHWLQFDSKNQEFYGIPKSADIGTEEYLLVAEDSGGLTATDALVVVVSHAPKKEFSAYFKAYLAIRHEQFNANLQRKFVESISELFNDKGTNYIQIRSVTTHHDSDGTIVNFYNTTLFKSHNRCPEEEIEAARNVYLAQDFTVRERVKRLLGPELNLTNVQVIPLGSCHPQQDITRHDFIPPKIDEPLLKSSFSDDYFYTFILPAAIIVVMIIVASIIACCLHRRRRKSGKMELGDEEERKSFRAKGIPVIFQDELDEKPEMGNKSPIILKDEKPPLLPPSYNTSNMTGDNDVDEYVPPPAVVVGGREARGKSPATPSYRKPPPYVSP